MSSEWALDLVEHSLFALAKAQHGAQDPVECMPVANFRYAVGASLKRFLVQTKTTLDPAWASLVADVVCATWINVHATLGVSWASTEGVALLWACCAELCAAFFRCRPQDVELGGLVELLRELRGVQRTATEYRIALDDCDAPLRRLHAALGNFYTPTTHDVCNDTVASAMDAALARLRDERVLCALLAPREALRGAMAQFWTRTPPREPLPRPPLTR